MLDHSIERVERWCVFELTIKGPSHGNPFLDVGFSACFQHKNRRVEADGFYDGEGVYKVRFMPDCVGEWCYETKSCVPALNAVQGAFECTPAQTGNHGPVRVHNTHHFNYEDGTTYYPFGTTCYSWLHHEEALQEQTLASLQASPFNKIRMFVFPKYYRYHMGMPVNNEVYERDPQLGTLDYTRFNTAFFKNLDNRIQDLMHLGIEADVILFHSYDYGRWNYDKMDPVEDERYLRYLVARIAAFRNVWWSLSNEFDLMINKHDKDWDRFFQTIQTFDPYQHLRSIHNGPRLYDHNKPWVTHCSIQDDDLFKVAEWRRQYNKPVVVDECGYEGDLADEWGNLTPQDMVDRFWRGFTCGGYVGHGETYFDPDERIWWSKGGALQGKSPERISFLRSILDAAPGSGLDYIRHGKDVSCAGRTGEFYLMYYGSRQPSFCELDLPKGSEFTIEILNVWDCTIKKLPGTYYGKCDIKMPAKPYTALRIQKSKTSLDSGDRL